MAQKMKAVERKIKFSKDAEGKYRLRDAARTLHRPEPGEGDDWLDKG